MDRRKDFWAKIVKDEQRKVVKWHSLIGHCCDVATVTEILLEKTVFKNRFARLSSKEVLSSQDIARVCVFSALHDAGKVNHGFQDRAFDMNAPKIGHVSPFMSVLLRPDVSVQKDILNALKFIEIGEWFHCEEDFVNMLKTSICHHGKPAEISTPDIKLWKSYKGRDPIKGLKRLRESVFRWFPEAFDMHGSHFKCPSQFQHGFNGLLTLADWIASDQKFFPFDNGREGDRRQEESRSSAEIAVKKLGLLTEEIRKSLGKGTPCFKSVSEHSPYDMQKKATDLDITSESSLVIIESTTGSGKTEAALGRFVQLFHNGLIDGMYFALPTRAAATQIHARIAKAVVRAFPDSSIRPPVILAVPGYLKVDKVSGQRLAPFEVRWEDKDRERFRYRGWAAENPKRYLAGTIAVGTIDQVLLSTLQVKHAHLRAASLLRNLLVVDEVHASDTYMDALLQEVLRYHLQAGGHAILMSATLGSSGRNTYLNRDRGSLQTLKEAARKGYPLITYTHKGKTSADEIIAQSTGYSKKVQIQEAKIASVYSGIAEIAHKAVKHRAKVLIIRNTVKDCIQTQCALEEKIPKELLFKIQHTITAPHHSRFADRDRKILDESVEEMFGKDSEPVPVVVSATQTVEQSLDIDSDLLITDICPVDVLLQRIGRLHRHSNRNRPEGFNEPKVVVITPEDRDLTKYIIRGGKKGGWACGAHGIGTVYDDLRIIEATWRLIETYSEWKVPLMNRKLVEEATHPDVLNNIVEGTDEAWKEHEEYILGLRSADRVHSGIVMLQRDKPFGYECFPTDLKEKIKTRLGLEDRRIIFNKGLIGPFGQKIEEITMPSHYASNADEDDKPEDISVSDGEITFAFAGKSFIYNRFGLHGSERD